MDYKNTQQTHYVSATKQNQAQQNCEHIVWVTLYIWVFVPAYCYLKLLSFPQWACFSLTVSDHEGKVLSVKDITLKMPSSSGWELAHMIKDGWLSSVITANTIGRRQAIIWTNAGILLFGPLRSNFSEILIEIDTFSFKKMHLKRLSAKWRPFCLGLNVLMACESPVQQQAITWTKHDFFLFSIEPLGINFSEM